MGILNRFGRIFVSGIFGSFYNKVSVSKYMKSKTKNLRRSGIKIDGTPKYIAPDVYFDSSCPSNICLGDNITISKQVCFLTHDYSITTALASIGRRIRRGDREKEIYFNKKIEIGSDCFIGIRALILPGTKIGDNSIIGGGCVVKGNIPENSIVIGNPAKIIGSTTDFANKHIEIGDYEREK